MSYQVLARKWRPKVFRELVGQEHVLQALINALDQDRLHHAYLFTGTRGVGKTTIARILARCLNCETGVSSEPCGQCNACVEISEGRDVDLIEVDAASRTKVEDTRELLENVQYAPTRARYKIYLIDEVHMLSGHSFNALLKTLEEPPPHVKFLLATTDPQKLPATILSRCLQFNLKNISVERISGHLADVLRQEAIDYEEPALVQLARSAEGSMRDALSLTDQAIAFGSGTVREAEVRTMLGTIDRGLVLQILEAVAASDSDRTMALVEQFAERAPDYENAMNEMLSILHRVAMHQAMPDLAAADDDAGAAIVEFAGSLTAEDVQLFYQTTLNGKRDLPFSHDPRAALEMTLIRMLVFKPRLDGTEIVSGGTPAPTEVGDPGKKLVEAPQPAEPEPEIPEPEIPEPGMPKTVEPIATLEDDQSPRPEPTADSEEVNPPAADDPVQTPPYSDWSEVLPALELSGIVQAVASHCCLARVDGPVWEFILDENQSALLNESCVEKLSTALTRHTGETSEARITIAAVNGETPAARQVRKRRERLEQAVIEIEKDPKVQLLLDRFDGVLDHTSIQPTDNETNAGL